MSRWFRFYAETLRNPKVMKLSDKDYRLWTRLLAVASENDGKIPPADDLKMVLAMRLDHLQGGLDRLISGGLIDVLSDGYEPHNWSKFQYKSDTSTERVTKHRAKRNVSVTPPDTETEADTESNKPPTSITLPRAEKGGVGEGEDLWKSAQACLSAGGVNSVAPARCAEAVELVKAWQQAGGDLEADILPAIREGVASGPDSVGSLKFYDQRVRTRIAKRASGVKPADVLKPPPPLAFNKPGEGAKLIEFRQALADEIGAPAYRNWLDETRIEQRGDVAEIHAGSPFKADHIRNRYGVQVGLIARRTLGVGVEIAA